MTKARWLAVASLTSSALCSVLLNACGSDDGRPGSLVSAGGDSGRGGGAGSAHAGSSGLAGRAGEDAGSAGAGDTGDAGAAGDASSAPAPLAAFPSQLQVNVSCGPTVDSTELVIRNLGTLPLTISSATATEGYRIEADLPLQIAPLASGILSITPPPPQASAAIGDTSTGYLTFATDEAGSSTHGVLLNTTLFGGQLEFRDSNGASLSGALPLTYLSSDVCPDEVEYRVQNTGNLAFTLLGPTMPAHFGGMTTGADGLNLAPNEYVELTVGGNSSSDGACSASGNLVFTAQGSFCGAVPTLSIVWPTNSQSAGCTCSAGTD